MLQLLAAAAGAPGYLLRRSAYLLRRSGWSPTAYDIVSVAAWALLIVGIVVAAFALAREIRSVPRA